MEFGPRRVYKVRREPFPLPHSVTYPVPPTSRHSSSKHHEAFVAEEIYLRGMRE
jgi:hypothetical protein